MFEEGQWQHISLFASSPIYYCDAVLSQTAVRDSSLPDKREPHLLAQWWCGWPQVSDRRNGKPDCQDYTTDRCSHSSMSRACCSQCHNRRLQESTLGQPSHCHPSVDIFIKHVLLTKRPQLQHSSPGAPPGWPLWPRIAGTTIFSNADNSYSCSTWKNNTLRLTRRKSSISSFSQLLCRLEYVS